MPTPIPAGLTLGVIEPKEAFAAFARRGALKQSFRWQDVWQSEHGRAFTVAGVMRDDVLRIVQDEIRTSLAEGRSLIDFKERITSQLTGKGFWGDVEVTDPATGETRVSRFDNRRLQLIYDVNLRQSNAAGRWERIERNKALFPLVLYRTMQDEKVRVAHAAWNGVALPVDHSFWQTHYPPNGWRCRCIAFATNERDLQRRADRGEKIKRQAPPVKYIDYVNPHTDEVRAVPAGIDPGFGYNPGRAARGHMAAAADLQGASIAKLESPIGAAVGKALPPKTRQVMDDAYREWLQAVQGETRPDVATRRRRPTVGTLAPQDVDYLASQAGQAPASADVVIGTTAITGPRAVLIAKRGDALPPFVLEQLPELLRRAVAVVHDPKSSTLIYLVPDPDRAGGLLAVEVGVGRASGGKVSNLVKEAYRTALADVLGELASAALRLVRGSLR